MKEEFVYTGPGAVVDARELTRASLAATFAAHVHALRDRARTGLERGAVTEDYGTEPSLVVQMLNEALATELLCHLRYKRHYFMASGPNAKTVAAEFLEHATEELDHADRLAKRIIELGGAPDFDPSTICERSHAEYGTGRDLKSMVEDDLVSERIAIETYRGMIRWLTDKDPTTRRLIEDLLAVEEEHAEDMAALLRGL